MVERKESEVLVITAKCWGGDISELITRSWLLARKTWISNLAFVCKHLTPEKPQNYQNSGSCVFYKHKNTSCVTMHMFSLRYF